MSFHFKYEELFQVNTKASLAVGMPDFFDFEPSVKSKKIMLDHHLTYAKLSNGVQVLKKVKDPDIDGGTPLSEITERVRLQFHMYLKDKKILTIYKDGSLEFELKPGLFFNNLTDADMVITDDAEMSKNGNNVSSEDHTKIGFAPQRNELELLRNGDVTPYVIPFKNEFTRGNPFGVMEIYVDEELMSKSRTNYKITLTNN